MKVGVIGAGASGLISAKLLLENGIDFDIFEGSDRIGGTWIYRQNLVDKNNLPVPSSMYKNLKTNLPKELMLFDGLNYGIEGKSFIPASDVLDYLQTFSKKFNIESKIKFENLVSRVSWKDESWELVSRNLKTGLEETYYYNSIFVCNGHYSIPSYPEICGSESFPGALIHSHYYKVPEIYQDMVVLIVGIGPSAIDITFDIAPFANKVYLSHHGPDAIKNFFPNNVIHKPDIKYINGSNIHFLDGTDVQVEAILYCTGYQYNFPFLDKSCEIKVDSNYVHPLYKQLVSISHNSMFFIGLPFRSFLFPLFEIQAKCAIHILRGAVKLPEMSEMEAETLAWEESLASKGITKNKYHCIADYVVEYFNDIIILGNLEPLPQVLFEIFAVTNFLRKTKLPTYRRTVFSVIDSTNFTHYENS